MVCEDEEKASENASRIKSERILCGRRGRLSYSCCLSIIEMSSGCPDCRSWKLHGGGESIISASHMNPFCNKSHLLCRKFTFRGRDFCLTTTKKKKIDSCCETVLLILWIRTVRDKQQLFGFRLNKPDNLPQRLRIISAPRCAIYGRRPAFGHLYQCIINREMKEAYSRIICISKHC